MGMAVHIGLGILFMLHGLAHLVGFLGTWNIGETGRKAYKTTILAGKADAGPRWIRVLGVLWLICALGFAAAAVLVWQGHPASFMAAKVSALASTVMCILFWPDARIGFFTNLLILAAVFWGPGRSN